MSVTQIRSLQYQLKSDDQLCLIHIPKTAGSTLTAIVDANFHVDEIFPSSTVGQFSPDELEAYRLFRDHFDYNIHRFFKTKPLYMTILRDPIDRAISLYEFWTRSRERAKPDEKPMSEVLQNATLGGLKGFTCHPDPRVRSRTSNRQVRQLAIGIGGLSNDPSARFSDDELLAMAKQNLDDCLFVGLTERFQESVFLMAYIFGWYPIADYQSLRVAARRSRKEDVPPDVLEAIAGMNQLDLALYEYGQERFQRDYAQMLEELRSHTGSPTPDQIELLLSQKATPAQRIEFLFSPLEQHYERRYAEHPPAPVRTYDFNCLQPVHGSGWHRRNGKKNGVVITDTPFRWTGPGTESTMDLTLEKGADLTIRVHIINAITPDVLDSFALTVNDHPVPLSPLDKRSHVGIFQGVIAADWLESDRPFTRLTLTVSQTLSPHELDPTNPDTRLVGLAVHRIQIFPTAAAIDTDQFAYYRFPEKDPAWTEVADFLDRHLKPDERLVAMGEFSKKFPKQFCSFLEPSFVEQPEVNWVVVHKGHYQDIQRSSLLETVRQFRPVFANPVFVVFSRRRELQALSPWSSHVLVLMMRIWLLRLEDRGILSHDSRRTLVSTVKVLLKPFRSAS